MFLDLAFKDPGKYAVTLGVLVGSIVLHELGHGIAALREGDTTPRIQGRMTWNPVVHMGWLSLGLAAVFGIAWGLMPINPRMFRHRRWGEAIVSFAGPAVNLLLVLVAAAVLAFTDQGSIAAAFTSDRSLAVVFWVQVLAMNALLAVFNLLPFPPLDGFMVFDSFVETGNLGAWLRAASPLPIFVAMWIMNQGLDEWSMLRAFDLMHAILGIA